MTDVAALCSRARVASRVLALQDTATKDAALRLVARGLRERAADVLAANARDLDGARASGMSGPLLDRLALDERRIEAMAGEVDTIASLEDPVGAVLEDRPAASGVRVRRVRVPLGVVAMIYEARPSVTAEASALCIKSGNAVVLRGGTEAAASNGAILAVLTDALASAGLPTDVVQALPPGERESIGALLRQTETVDLCIPRGGPGLVAFVRENARVPVIAHAQGVCHLYVDQGADVAMAVALAVNGKLQRPGVCNALECLLVDAQDAARVLPPIARGLLDGGCELRGCERVRAVVSEARPATDDDWGREYLDRILAVRVVDGLDGALAHVARYGSRHTEAICTQDDARADRWRREIDAACVVVNASTRFHDGAQLGLGAEIGIATSKLHWRGAMGLESLTTFQWRLDGTGQVRGG